MQLTFANSTYKKNGLYFEVNMIHQSNHQLKTNTQFNVTCKLLQEYVIASRIIAVYNTNGGNHVIDSDESSTLYDSDAFSTTPNSNESSTLPDSDESSTFPDLDEFLPQVFVISLSVTGILTLIMIGSATIKFCIAERQKRKRSYKDLSIIEMERIKLADEKDHPTINSSATEPILVDIVKEL
ncbi:uncharacterized protein [Mytilus edulis]|uniref:uncharacterized protein n=1 Tax=Mytilus edulis TaxID=6550 RepID=UPI0039EEE27F